MCKFFVEYSASVTAVFELEDGTEKSFMRSVQGSSSEHRINNTVCLITSFYFEYVCLIECLQIFFVTRLSPVKCI